MCSICGTFSADGTGATLTTRMLSRTQHRGPDQAGVYVDGQILRRESAEGLNKIKEIKGRISLGHARLEIVGGTEGVQPLGGCLPGWAIVVNGEIYNHLELRGLIKKHALQSDSDSELIIHLIEQHYKDTKDLAKAVRRTMPMLDGMYALAVTDGRQLVLARDPVGKKPVYFVQTGVFAFASERKALCDLGGPIRRLVPGGVLSISGEGRRVQRTQRFHRPPIDIIDFDEALGRYDPAFRRAVEKRVRGLDRIGVLFSGGIDSLMVAVAARQTGTDTVAYCVGMEGSDDLAAARQSARLLGLDVRVMELTEAMIESMLPEVIERIELNGTIQVEAAIPMYVAARMCSEEGRKVMLSGQAADELFAGYSWYRDVVRDEGYVVLHERLWDDIEKLYLDTLEREDRMSMAHGVELRAPFLDRDVINTAMRMTPEGIKITGPDDPLQKRVHRALAVKYGIPEPLAYREKSRAQDGTGIHKTLQRIARRRTKKVTAGTAQLLDYGSNYRYLKEKYSGDEVNAFIHDVTRRHGISGLGTAHEEEYESEVVP